MGEFTVRHWKVPYEGCGWKAIPRLPRAAVESSGSKVNGSLLYLLRHQLTLLQGEDNIGCPTDVLQLVVHTCSRAIVDTTSERTDPNAGIEEIKALERKISRSVGNYGPLHLQYDTPLDRNSMVSDLHRLACLIYVNRAVHCVSGMEFNHERLVREGILLLTKMVTCQNAWPLFIIGCEAIADDQRLAILDVLEQSRTDQRRRSSHIHLIQHMVEAVWKQHDLNAENQVDHLTILDAVVGGVPFIPPLA